MRRAILWLMAAGLCSAQTIVNGGRDFKGTLKTSGTISLVDFSAAGSTAPVKAGTIAARPAACVQGQLYFSTDAVPGQNLSACTTTGTPGTWTQIGAGGSSGGGIPFDSQVGLFDSIPGLFDSQ